MSKINNVTPYNFEPEAPLNLQQSMDENEAPDAVHRQGKPAESW